RRELTCLSVAVGRDLNTHQPVVQRVRAGPNEPGLLGAVDELARAVMPEEELLRDLADRRGNIAAQALHHDQQLVLRRCDALRLGSIVAPSEEPTRRGPE